MIHVEYHRKLHKVIIKGHAGSAPHGEDLVCAAVSALTYTLAANACELRDGGYTRHINTKVDAGDSEISVVPTSRYASVAELVISAVCVGFEVLAEQYPDYVKFHEIL